MICPKCGTEYREGFTECAYCKIPLVEALPEGVDADQLYRQHERGIETSVPSGGLFTEEELLLEAARRGLSREDIRDMMERMAEEGVLNFSEEDPESAEFLFEEEEAPLNPEDPEETGEEGTERTETAKGSFRPASVRANDMKSSGVTLCLVGALGGAVLLLSALGVFPVRLYGPGRFVSYGTLGLLFVVFLFFGIRSLTKVSELEEEADREEEKIRQIEDWFRETFSAEEISLSGEKLSLGGEDPYFPRTRFIKSEIGKRFMDLDPAFLDYVTEDLYQDIFEETEKPE